MAAKENINGAINNQSAHQRERRKSKQAATKWRRGEMASAAAKMA
jgi:hypothetical protein